MSPTYSTANKCSHCIHIQYWLSFEKSKRRIKYSLPILLTVPMTTLAVHGFANLIHLLRHFLDVIIPFNAQAWIYFGASAAMCYGLCVVSSFDITTVYLLVGSFWLSYWQSFQRFSTPFLLCFSQKKQLNRRLLPSGVTFHDSDLEFRCSPYYQFRR